MTTGRVLRRVLRPPTLVEGSRSELATAHRCSRCAFCSLDRAEEEPATLKRNKLWDEKGEKTNCESVLNLRAKVERLRRPVVAEAFGSAGGPPRTEQTTATVEVQRPMGHCSASTDRSPVCGAGTFDSSVRWHTASESERKRSGGETSFGCRLGFLSPGVPVVALCRQHEQPLFERGALGGLPRHQGRRRGGQHDEVGRLSGQEIPDPIVEREHRGRPQRGHEGLERTEARASALSPY